MAARSPAGIVLGPGIRGFVLTRVGSPPITRPGDLVLAKVPRSSSAVDLDDVVIYRVPDTTETRTARIFEIFWSGQRRYASFVAGEQHDFVDLTFAQIQGVYLCRLPLVGYLGRHAWSGIPLGLAALAIEWVILRHRRTRSAQSRNVAGESTSSEEGLECRPGFASAGAALHRLARNRPLRGSLIIAGAVAVIWPLAGTWEHTRELRYLPVLAAHDRAPAQLRIALFRNYSWPTERWTDAGDQVVQAKADADLLATQMTDVPAGIDTIWGYLRAGKRVVVIPAPGSFLTKEEVATLYSVFAPGAKREDDFVGEGTMVTLQWRPDRQAVQVMPMTMSGSPRSPEGIAADILRYAHEGAPRRISASPPFTEDRQQNRLSVTWQDGARSEGDGLLVDGDLLSDAEPAIRSYLDSGKPVAIFQDGGLNQHQYLAAMRMLGREKTDCHRKGSCQASCMVLYPGLNGRRRSFWSSFSSGTLWRLLDGKDSCARRLDEVLAELEYDESVR